MKAFALALIAGCVIGNGAFAGDLRPSLAPGPLRPSISRPSLTEGLGVHPPAQPSGQAPAYGYGPPPSAGGAGARSDSSTGMSGGIPGAGPAGASGAPPEYGAPLPPGVAEGAVVRKVMGLDAGGRGRDGVFLPPGVGEGAVVRKSMGMDPNGAGDVLPPGVGEGAVVRRAMGFDDNGGPGSARTTKADDPLSPPDADPGRGAKAPPRARGSGASVGVGVQPGRSGSSIQWEYMRSALRTGLTKLLEWAGDY